MSIACLISLLALQTRAFTDVRRVPAFRFRGTATSKPLSSSWSSDYDSAYGGSWGGHTSSNDRLEGYKGDKAEALKKGPSKTAFNDRSIQFKEGASLERVDTPLRAMIFVDGTWLYYTMYTRPLDRCKIKQTYGENWEDHVYINWAVLPRIIARAIEREMRETIQGKASLTLCDIRCSVRNLFFLWPFPHGPMCARSCVIAHKSGAAR